MAITPVPSVPTLPGIGGIERPQAPANDGGAGFGRLVGEQLGRVHELEQNASQQSRALATGMSDDLAGALVSVERADLALQLTTQLRNKAVEAYQEVMRMQV